MNRFTTLLSFISLYLLSGIILMHWKYSEFYIYSSSEIVSEILPITQEQNHKVIKSSYEDEEAPLFNCSFSNDSESEFSLPCFKIWNGDALEEQLPQLYSIEITVILSYCNEDIQATKTYLETEYSKQMLKTMVVIPICKDYSGFMQLIPIFEKVLIFNSPRVKNTTEEAYLEYLSSKYKPSAAADGYSENSENHFLLFLTPKSLNDEEKLQAFLKRSPNSKNNELMPMKYAQSQTAWEPTIDLYLNKYRKTQDIVQSAQENGVGCVLKPLTSAHSLYHDLSIIHEMGCWLNFSDMFSYEQDIIPVCYGSTFLVQESIIVEHRQVLYFLHNILTKLTLDVRRKFSSYLERSWAGIFSYALPKNQITSIKTFNDHGFDEYYHKGALMALYYENKKENDSITSTTAAVATPFYSCYHSKYDNSSHCPLWENSLTMQQKKAQVLEMEKLSITLVISHCNERLLWMHSYFKGVSIKKAVIISKCNSPIKNIPFNAEIIKLNNVGRCDHSYAYWMSQMKESDYSEHDLILFIKGSRLAHQFLSQHTLLHELIDTAQRKGFACGQQLSTNKLSLFHDTPTLRKFLLKEYYGNISSPFENFGVWSDFLGNNISFPVTPVCYGGNFATKASNVFRKKPEFWGKLVKSLSRGDSIEEGHFAERAWAGLLTDPLTDDELKFIKRYSNAITTDGRVGYFGMLGRL